MQMLVKLLLQYLPYLVQLKFAENYRTYIFAGVAAAVCGYQVFTGALSLDQLLAMLGLSGAAGLATLRSAVARAVAKATDK